jgi:outer membrane protein
MLRVGVYALLPVLLITGCSPQVLPQIARAPLLMPQTTADALAASRPPIPPPVTIPSEGCESLEQAWAAAQASDCGLQAQHCGESAAEQATMSARAEQWPAVGLEGAYTGRTAEPSFKVYLQNLPFPSTTFPYEQTDEFAAKAKVDLPLYTGGRIQRAIAAAEADQAALASDVEESLMDLKMRVAQVYVSVLRAQRDVEVANHTVQSLESHAAEVESFLRQGRAQQTDLLAAQVALSNARCDGVQACNRLDSSRAAYNRHLGRPLTAPVRLAELPLEMPSADVENLTAVALHFRPALARFTKSANALDHRAESVRAKDAPQVFLRAEYDYEEDRYRVPEGIGAAGVGVTWNLFDGGRNRCDAKNLSAQAQALRFRRKELESLIALDVRRAWLDVLESRRRLDATRQAIEQAEENVRVTRRRYSLGSATNTEVIDAETLYTQAYRNHDAAMYETVLASLRLRRMTGELRDGAAGPSR